MDVAAPQPVRHAAPPRRSGGLLWPVVASCIACLLAFASVLGTMFLLERPGASERVAALLDGKLIHTVAEADLPGIRGLSGASVDQSATGSIGGDGPGPVLFGADIGPGSSLAGLRDLWSRTGAKAGLDGVRPVANIRDVDGGHELHLVAGPFGDAAQASRLCARVASVAPGCTIVPFVGQDLSNH